MKPNNIEKFLSLIVIKQGCWDWKGNVDRDGYPIFSFSRFNKVTKRAQRLIYQFVNGKFNPSLSVLHKCDNTLCLNPDHLFLGNQKDNILDMYSKKRNRNQFTDIMFCVNGHKFTQSNTYIRKNGNRSCRECSRIRSARVRNKIYKSINKQKERGIL